MRCTAASGVSRSCKLLMFLEHFATLSAWCKNALCNQLKFSGVQCPVSTAYAPCMEGPISIQPLRNVLVHRRHYDQPHDLTGCTELPGQTKCILERVWFGNPLLGYLPSQHEVLQAAVFLEGRRQGNTGLVAQLREVGPQHEVLQA